MKALFSVLTIYSLSDPLGHVAENGWDKDTDSFGSLPGPETVHATKGLSDYSTLFLSFPILPTTLRLINNNGS